jgi:rhodanese-related sulfurtransferase
LDILIRVKMVKKVKKSKSEKKVLYAHVFLGVVLGVLLALVLMNSFGDNSGLTEEEKLIKEFYDVETATHVSPHGLRKHMGEDDSYILVDLRSQEEYEEEHITTAFNVPAYKDKDHSDYGAVDRIVSEFQALQVEFPDREFIVYCYSTPCMTGRKVGKILADNDIFVKHLGIGWNDWRYDWESWNHPHEWGITSAEDYVSSGSEPGELDKDLTGAGCPIEGGLGC